MDPVTSGDSWRDIMVGAVMFTFFTAIMFVAFVKQRKVPVSKVPATVCLSASTLGTILAWLGVAIAIYQKEPSHVSLKLLTVGSVLILYPLGLWGSWFAHWLADVLKLRLREQRILFRIGGVGIRLSQIMIWVLLLVYACKVVYILSMRGL